MITKRTGVPLVKLGNGVYARELWPEDISEVRDDRSRDGVVVALQLGSVRVHPTRGPVDPDWSGGLIQGASRIALFLSWLAGLAAGLLCWWACS